MSILMRVVRTLTVVVALLGAGAPLAQAQAPQSPPTTAAQDEYVPIDQLPEDEKLPAAPFLIGAYAVAWVAILVYLLMLWRKLGRVEQELQTARRATGGR